MVNSGVSTSRSMLNADGDTNALQSEAGCRLTADLRILVAVSMAQSKMDASPDLQLRIKQRFHINYRPCLLIVPEVHIQLPVDVGDGWSFHGSLSHAFAIVEDFELSE